MFAAGKVSSSWKALFPWSPRLRPGPLAPPGRLSSKPSRRRAGCRPVARAVSLAPGSSFIARARSYGPSAGTDARRASPDTARQPYMHSMGLTFASISANGEERYAFQKSRFTSSASSWSSGPVAPVTDMPCSLSNASNSSPYSSSSRARRDSSKASLEKTLHLFMVSTASSKGPKDSIGYTNLPSSISR